MQYPLLAALSPPVVSSLLNSYSNMMQYPLVAALWSFLIEFRTKYAAISSPGCLASCCGRFLLNSYSNIKQYPLMAVLPPPVVVSYWIPIQIWCSILCWLPYLLPHSFIIESLIKYNAISSLGCLASSCGVAALPPAVGVPYWNPIVMMQHNIPSLGFLASCCGRSLLKPY